ncbi:MAG: hypothetical protein JJU45_17180 [Acidimicrobiia bacterium]|nr:hypothetical protein [Acidimicrobiia bacterium]
MGAVNSGRDPVGTLPVLSELDAQARQILAAHWRPEGYTVPNAQVYPHQWLWDSCFHAVVWLHLGEHRRAVSELRCALEHQGPDGFVPHMVYRSDLEAGADFWGRIGTSCITQPPVYGHAVAAVVRAGVTVPDEMIDAAVAGVQHLLDRRPDDASLVPIWHPWESGCDDSPRWEGWCRGGWDVERWRAAKGEMVAGLRFATPEGRAGSEGPVGNDRFCVGSVAFSALVAFAGAELLSVRADLRLSAGVDHLRRALADAYDPEVGTWVDRPAKGSGAVPTLEALLPVLVAPPDQVDVVMADLLDDRRYGGRCGPAQVRRDVVAYSPLDYWRGAAWPQLGYLLWVAAQRAGCSEHARHLAARLVRGAASSGFAEYWHPDSGAPGGARPQSWATLAAVVGPTASG